MNNLLDCSTTEAGSLLISDVFTAKVSYYKQSAAVRKPQCFTYRTGFGEKITAITLLERDVKETDVVTIYFKDVHSMACFNNAVSSTISGDQIIIGEQIDRNNIDHVAAMHKPDGPLALHCHILKGRDEVNSLIEQVFLRQSYVSRMHYPKYLFSKAYFQKAKKVTGLQFDDGSISYNKPCENMCNSEEIDCINFKKIKIPEWVQRIEDSTISQHRLPWHRRWRCCTIV